MSSKAIDYKAVLMMRANLASTEAAYLKARDWTLRESDGRWIKLIPWGASSVRPVEADRLDAVRYQAQHDGDIPPP